MQPVKATVIDLSDSDGVLMIKFSPEAGKLWHGRGRLAEHTQEDSELDPSGREVLELLGRHRYVSEVEIFSIDLHDRVDNIVFLKPTPPTTYDELTAIVIRLLSEYLQCDIEQVRLLADASSDED